MRTISSRRLLLTKTRAGVGLLGLMLSTCSVPGRAADFFVPNGDTAGLIAAINNANNETAYPGSDTIRLASGGLYTLTGRGDPTNFYGFNGLPVISSTIVIEGSGATIERSNAAGTPTFRFFAISANAANHPPRGNLTLRNVILRGGMAKGGDGAKGRGGGGGGAGLGGAVYNLGFLTVVNCTFHANTAQGGRGGNGNYLYSWGAGGGGGLGGNGGNAPGPTPATGYSDHYTWAAGGGGGFGGNGGHSGVLIDNDFTGGGGGEGGGRGANGEDAFGQYGNNGGHRNSPEGGDGGDPGYMGKPGGFGGGGGGSGRGVPPQGGFYDRGDGGDGGIGGGGGGGNGGRYPGVGMGGHGGAGGYGGGGGGGYYGDFYNPQGGGGNGGFGGGGGGYGRTLFELPGEGGAGGFGGGGGARGDHGGAGGGGAGFGGAIFNDCGTLTVTNSTLSGNAALGGAAGTTGGATYEATAGKARGGGIFARNGSILLVHVTMTDNQATDGGGAFYALGDREIVRTGDVDSVSVRVSGCILANTPAAAQATDAYLNINSLRDAKVGSNNLIERNGTGLNGIPGVIATGDPLLGALQDNGGLTPSHALLPGSPAMNRIAGIVGEDFPATDQRGIARPQGSHADIGAFELDAATISGTLTLQGIIAGAPIQPIDFVFRPDDNSGDIVRTANVTSNGVFSVPGIPNKRYTLHVKGERYLGKNVGVDATGGNVSGVSALLKAGDSNNDNSADITDLLALIACYNRVSPNAGYAANVDFNLDGTVDITDLLLLISNYNQKGDN